MLTHKRDIRAHFAYWLQRRREAWGLSPMPYTLRRAMLLAQGVQEGEKMVRDGDNEENYGSGGEGGW